MKWEKDATDRHERMPVPPNIAPLARKQAEKCARSKGLACVTVKEVLEAEEAYAVYFGRQKTQEMRNLLECKKPVPCMVEDLFFDPSETLCNIQVCPVKYGSQSEEVADDILTIFNGIKEIFEREHMDEIVAALSRAPLNPSARFNVVIDGCSNCCEPPFFKDLGIIGQHIPEVTAADCLQCKKCIRVCYEDAVTFDSDGPHINRERCINCEFCAKSCPDGKIVIGQRGYKVTAGGYDHRHPAIARTVKSFTDIQGALETVEKAVNLLKKGAEGDTLKSLLEKHGVAALQ